ncbi:hypothetical protein CLAFUW4_08317 [Fulvia fulva]|uniref:DUF6604 domain-containing protein n=1 Tax=Passalora fulva TaxID=5499 RepID=A0A9Q8LCH3_PASFU|nr:uncharacterized protein CLAFUR5_08425 [Fulvia fulva]KAK4629107.1 hypothetical protein CLAFUR4_08322 [Fulvia fulva]KAK4630261.1 hypothetical protein CLAFUR0_08317 [Fulvia fulva]UJO14845.1 hypothetical protein CLAFUR5_08425 [Fulvia fulva]WPV12621.1 hypothetical protein CLAFUW4_08317 [Fulvia fulva]WPV27892.1 hypothetical protein CLAFUW7_08317 [Fulvia fulva]
MVNATDPRIDIPVDILDVAKDTIAGRRKCAAWYAGAPSADVESDKTHVYFLEVLEKIFEMLRKEHKSRLPKRKKKVELATDLNDLSNLYRHLELEDPTTIEQEAGGNLPASTSSKPVQKTQRVELDTDPEDDLRFAVWCFLSDLQEIRQESRETWLAYKRGEISFVVGACKVTEKTAVLANAALISFHEDHPTCIGHEAIIDLVGREICVCGSRGRGYCTSPDHTHDGPSPRCFANTMMLEAWSPLHDMEDLITWLTKGHDMLPDSKDYRPVVVHPRHPFAKALFNITADLVSMVQKGSDYKALFAYADTLGQHLLWLAQGGTSFTTPQVFSVQLYMDIYDILDGELEQGLRELTAAYRMTQDSLEDFVKVRQRMGSPLSSTALMLCPLPKPHQVDGREGWLLDASEAHGIKRVSASFGPQFVPANVLATLPILCGRLAFDVVSDWQSCGVNLANRNSTVLATAHLYKATAVQSPFNQPWLDMETAIARQVRPEGTMYREGENTVRDVAKRYCLAMGVPLAQVAQKHHPKRPADSVSMKKAYRLIDRSVFALAEMDACWNSDRRQLISKPQSTFFYECMRRYTRLGGKLQDNALIEHWTKTGRLTSCQLLRVVRQITAADRLVGQCHLILSSVSRYYATKSKAKVPAHLKTEYPQPNLLINEMLWEAAGSQTRGLKVESTVLHAIGLELQDIISTNGGTSTSMAHELSLGYAKYWQARETSPSIPSLASNDRYPSRQIIEHQYTSHIIPESEFSPTLLCAIARAVLRYHEPFMTRPWNMKKVKQALRDIQKMFEVEVMAMGLRHMCHLTLTEYLIPEMVVYTQDEMDGFTKDRQKYLRDLECGLRFLKDGEEELRYFRLR